MAARSDNFNRTGSPDLHGSTPSDGGSTWVEETPGTIKTDTDATSGQVVAYNLASPMSAWLESSVTNHRVSGVPLTSISDVGVIARVQDASNYYLWRTTNAAPELFKQVAGSFALLATGSGAATSAEPLELSCDGTDIKGYVNGVEEVSVSDNALTTGTKVGIRIQGFIDDFSSTDLGGTGTTIVLGVLSGGGTLIAPVVTVGNAITPAPIAGVGTLIAPVATVSSGATLTPLAASGVVVAPAVSTATPVTLTPLAASGVVVAPSIALVTGIVLTPLTAVGTLVAPAATTSAAVTLTPLFGGGAIPNQQTVTGWVTTLPVLTARAAIATIVVRISGAPGVIVCLTGADRSVVALTGADYSIVSLTGADRSVVNLEADLDC